MRQGSPQRTNAELGLLAELGVHAGRSGRPDLNRGPPAPEAGALTGLRYAPCVGGVNVIGRPGFGSPGLVILSEALVILSEALVILSEAKETMPGTGPFAPLRVTKRIDRGE